ncbi:MAG: immune inhibitor A [Chloroflexi bacterium]|nr:immune inhibitor A [Chloroflexota bacterium]
MGRGGRVLLGALAVSGLLVIASPVHAQATPTDLEARLEATALPTRDNYDLAVRLGGVSSAAVYAPVPPVGEAQLGESRQFWVLDQPAAQTFQVSATLRLITDHAYWYVQDDRAGRVSMEALERSANVFEWQTFPTIEHFFGGDPAGFPGAGDPHVLFLLGRVPGVAGYFSGADTYPAVVHARSNDREMIYVNVDALEPGQDEFDGIMAHEFQHLLHYARCPGQETWVDEGSSELASRVDGYAGSAPQAFSARPGVQLTAWASSQPDELARHYQAAYLFVRYVAERYGGWDALPALLQPCLRGPALFDRFLQQVGSSEHFDDLFTDWTVANLVGDAGLADGRYGYDGGPGQVRLAGTAEADQPFESTPAQYAADYVELPPAASTVRFAGDPTVAALAAPAPSGGAMWWSNRGDDLDSRLTRRLDLRAVAAATARFRAWYDVENQFDYVYVSGSVDGGATWTMLSGQASTPDASVGNGFGVGWSGTSGGGGTPTWIDEQVDLSPLAGHDALLRFEYVTDQAYNGEGFALADFQVPELGLDEPGAVEGSWAAEGWVRVDGPLPEHWQLRLVRWLEGGVSVDAEPVGADGRATIALDASARREVLVVAPTALRTLEPAHYVLSVGG